MTTSPSDWSPQFFQSPDFPAYQSTTANPSNQSEYSTVVSVSPQNTANNTIASSPNSYYNHSLSHLRHLAAGRSGSTTISFESSSTATTTDAAAVSSSSTGTAGKSSKRRRSRESWKNPTPLFNTDPKNFRAMVQRYTGSGAAAAVGDGGSSESGLGTHYTAEVGGESMTVADNRDVLLPIRELQGGRADHLEEDATDQWMRGRQSGHY